MLFIMRWFKPGLFWAKLVLLAVIAVGISVHALLGTYSVPDMGAGVVLAWSLSELVVVYRRWRLRRWARAKFPDMPYD